MFKVGDPVVHPVVGKQIYEKGLTLLAGEIAAVQGIDLADAETQVKARLSESLSPNRHNASACYRADC